MRQPTAYDFTEKIGSTYSEFGPTNDKGWDRLKICRVHELRGPLVHRRWNLKLHLKSRYREGSVFEKLIAAKACKIIYLALAIYPLVPYILRLKSSTEWRSSSVKWTWPASGITRKTNFGCDCPLYNRLKRCYVILCCALCGYPRLLVLSLEGRQLPQFRGTLGMIPAVERAEIMIWLARNNLQQETML